ncbi:hypothetical protein HY464_02470 [Candidatus Peregrinibacteria bacterium]|nr:hypothetical protein [Candidatus Peregrinibacteria bacterium]
MLHLDTSAAMAKLLTPTYGVTNEEITQLRTTARRYVEQWLGERRGGDHAWSMDPYNRPVLTRVQETVEKFQNDRITNLLWIGIGGSALATKVIRDVLGPSSPRTISVLDTIDPATIDHVRKRTDWPHTALIVASKSGDTLESMSAFFFFWGELKKALGRKAKTHVLAITDPSSGALRRFCEVQSIATIPIPPPVGGRFSAFTPVSLLPLNFLQGNTAAFLRGAKEMDTLCQQTTIEENPALKLALIQFLLVTKRHYPLRTVMPYSQRLWSLAQWNQQLIAESLGKNEGKNPIPLAALGSQDQHSLLQQWLAGPRMSWHLFIQELEKPRVAVPTAVEPTFAFIAGKTFGELLDACAEGTRRALTNAKRAHVTLSITRLDEAHLGQLFFLFMAETVFLGKFLRIDPYGQPAVEQGKKITREILSK